MIDIHFEIGGRRVRAEEIGSAIDAMVFDAIVENLRMPSSDRSEYHVNRVVSHNLVGLLVEQS